MCKLSQYNPISVCHDERLQNLFKQTHQSVCGALVFPQIIFGFAVCTLIVNRFATKLLAIWRCVNFSPWYSTNRMGLLQIRSTQMKPSNIKPTYLLQNELGHSMDRKRGPCLFKHDSIACACSWFWHIFFFHQPFGYYDL